MLEHHYPLCHSSTAGTIPAPREQFFHRRGGWYGPKWLDRGGRWFGPWTDTGSARRAVASRDPRASIDL